MTLLYALNAAADGVALPFVPTPVRRLPPHVPPKISRPSSMRVGEGLTPRSLEHDVWMFDVAGTRLGRVVSDDALHENTRRITTNTGATFDIEEKGGKLRIIRGRLDGRALWGHIVSLSPM